MHGQGTVAARACVVGSVGITLTSRWQRRMPQFPAQVAIDHFGQRRRRQCPTGQAAVPAGRPAQRDPLAAGGSRPKSTRGTCRAQARAGSVCIRRHMRGMVSRTSACERDGAGGQLGSLPLFVLHGIKEGYAVSDHTCSEPQGPAERPRTTARPTAPQTSRAARAPRASRKSVRTRDRNSYRLCYWGPAGAQMVDLYRDAVTLTWVLDVALDEQLARRLPARSNIH